jgi:K+-sensing histidine kinase KdpD
MPGCHDSGFSATGHGLGILPGALERVFDRFETNSLGSHRRGTRIGLSPVPFYVEFRGGSVEIASSSARGTAVTCTIPFGEAARMSAA